MKLNHRRIAFFFALGILFVPVLFLSAKSQSNDEITIVEFKSQAAKEEFIEEHSQAKNTKLEKVATFQEENWLRKKIIETELVFDKNVQSVESGKMLHKTLTPNDTYASSQWALTKMWAQQGWDITTGNVSNIIAIIDTGTQLNHPDLDDKIWDNTAEATGTPGVDDDENGYIDDNQGWDFGNDDNNPTDVDGHGTAVAGAAAAESNNSQGVAGIDWQAKIMILKIWQNGEEYASEADAAAAIRYAADNGAKIINMSFGSTTDFSVMQSAVTYAYNKGCVMVGAAGNDGASETVLYPGRYSEVIGVGSVDSSYRISSFTNRGSTGLDLYAPGQGIYTTKLGSTYGSVSGTSIAAPLVSGAASLLKTIQPDLTPIQVKAKLKKLIFPISGTSAGSTNIFKILKVKIYKSPDSGYYYLIDETNSYRITLNSSFWDRYNWCPSYAENVTIDKFTGITNQGWLNGWIKSPTSNYSYYVDLGLKYPFINNYLFRSKWGIASSDITTMSSDVLTMLTTTHSLSDLVRASGGNQVYFVDYLGSKYKVPATSSFYRDWGFTGKFVSTVSANQLTSTPNRGYLGRSVSGSQHYYKCRMISGKCSWNVPNYYSIITISQAQFDSLPKW